MDSRIFPFGRLPDAISRIVGGPEPISAQGLREVVAAPLVGLVRNPRSHRNKGHHAALAASTNVLLAETRTRAELEAALARFAQAGIGMLAISGGDGTVRDVLTRGAPLFGDNWPAIAILPQGKTNALALDLGIERRWSLDQALAAFARDKFVARRPIVVTDAEAAQRERWGFIFGAGVFNAAIDAGQVAHRFGAFQSFAIGVTVAFGMAQAMFGFGRSAWRNPSRMTLTDAMTGEAVPHSGMGPRDSRYIVGITTLRRFPLGMKLLAGVEDKGPIGYFLIDAPRRRALARVPGAAMGRTDPGLARFGLHRGGGTAFDVVLEDGFILDGEWFPAGAVRISAGPELQFVAQ